MLEALRTLRTFSSPEGFPWGARGGVWPLALLPVEEPNYGSLGFTVLRSFLALARVGNEADQRAWLLFHAWRLLLCDLGKGFPCTVSVCTSVK